MCFMARFIYELKQGLDDGTLIFPVKKSDDSDDDEDENNFNWEDYLDENEERDEYSPLEIPKSGSHKVIWACFWGAHQVRNIVYIYN